MFMITFFYLMVFAYLYVQWHSLKNMQGGWRKASLVSAGLMALVLLITLYALLSGSNLWPLWLFFSSPIALIYQGVLHYLWKRSEMSEN